GGERRGCGRHKRGAKKHASPGEGQGHLGSFTPDQPEADGEVHACSRARHL
ncbi:MAG: hypothetical protein AVDCRST_MAG90-2847, partial [uncultured Microvirga sp.]